ncbi:MAG: response regulator transcription factor [Gammaproteobacteria bacterium]|nr:response regulator transcription factor [Gammaproteobacteria bacterium]
MEILLVEDHADLAANVAEYLRVCGHRVECADHGQRGLERAQCRHFDVVVLDRMLPGLDGASLCRQLRRRSSPSTPVLMLTALDTTRDKLEGFAAGADDYLVKPFALAELEARLTALHRLAQAAPLTRVLQVGDLRYDIDVQKITRGGEPVELTPACRRLLQTLMRASPRVVSHAELRRTLWGGEPPVSDALRTHLHALRLTIDRGRARRLLQTVHGFGYRIVDDS